MNRKNTDDIFREGLQDYHSEIDPNEIWAGIQDKKPTPSNDDARPFPWWILGTLLLVVATTAVVSNMIFDQDHTVDTINTTISTKNVLNTSNGATPQTVDAVAKNEIANPSVADINLTNTALTTEGIDTNKKRVSKKSTPKNDVSAIASTVSSNEFTNKIEGIQSSENATNRSNIVSPPNSPTISNPIINFNNNYNNTFPINQDNNTIFETKTTTTQSKVYAVQFLESNEAIPVRSSMEGNDITNVEIPDMRVPDDITAEGCYGKPRMTIAIGAHVSPDFVMHNISSSNQDLSSYIDERKRTEDLLESFHAGLDIYLQRDGGLYFRTGIEYAQINRKFSFDKTWAAIDDSNNTVTTFVREKRTTNQYRLIDIPLTVGYEFEANKSGLSVFVEAGVSINVLFDKKGDILDPNSPSDSYEPISFTDGDANQLDIYSNNVGLSILGGIGLKYELMDGLFIYAQPAGKLYLNSFTKNDNEVNERFSRVGINFGAIRKF